MNKGQTVSLQFDYQKRVVSIENLKAMCERISSTCHRFAIYSGEASRSRVRVSYSNPDEYGNPHPVVAVFPAYFSKSAGLSVVLDAISYTGCTGNNEEAWQAFWQLYDCPELFRSGWDGPWRTWYEILVEKFPAYKVTSTWDKDGCIQTWHCNGSQFKGYREAQDFAVHCMKDLKA